MGMIHYPGSSDVVIVRSKCDNSSTLQWYKDPMPQPAKTRDGTTRICHSMGNNCLAVERQFFTREYKVVFKPYNQNQRNQQWKMDNKTGQFWNVETLLCLTSYSTKNNLPNKSNNLLYGMEECSKKKQKKLAQQKWSLVQLPKCKKSP